MRELNLVLETALDVTRLNQTAAFYAHKLERSCIHEDYRMRTYDVGGNGILLLFAQGGSLRLVDAPG